MHLLVLRLLEGVGVALCLLLVKLGWFLVRCWRARRAYLASDIPGPPLSSQILGHIPDIMGPKGVWSMATWANSWGPLYKLQYLDEFAVVLTDPDAIARITRRTGPGPYMPKPRHFYDALERGTTPNLPNILTSDDGDYWKAVRQAAAPCFSMTNLRKVLPQAVDLTKRVADRMCRCGGLFDVTDGAKRITSDIMGDMLLGEDLGGTRWEPSAYLDFFIHVLQAQASLLNNPFHLWQLWRADIRLQRRSLAAHNRLMDDKVRRMVLHQAPPEHTIAAHLLKAIDPDTGKPLHKDRLKAEIAIFMAAGFETTSHAITWSLAALATFPDVQEELFQELVAAGLAAADEGLPAAAAARDIDSSDLGRLPFLSAVIKEVLRLCPPAPFGGSRQVVNQEGAQLCGYKVHKGTVVIIPSLPLALAQHTFGPDAAEFRPQRWLDAASSRSNSPVSSEAGGPQQGGPAAAAAAAAASGPAAPPDPMTFMVGPRDCIGQNLAKLELHVVLATLLSRFKFSPGPELHKEIQLAAATGQPPISALHALAGVHITLQPLSGSMMLQVEPRHGVMA